jgi:hypothetical protein
VVAQPVIPVLRREREKGRKVGRKGGKGEKRKKKGPTLLTP